VVGKGEPVGPGGAQRGGWEARVRVASTGAFAYHPEHVVTTGGQRAVEVARRFARELRAEEVPDSPFTVLRGIPDPLPVIEELRLAGLIAQPDHVLFAHATCGCACGPHPSTTWSCGSPHASPVYASPVYASPVYASPVYASPADEDYRRTGARRSSARPVPRHETADLELPAEPIDAAISVVVLDTGLAADRFRSDALGPAHGAGRIVAAGPGEEEVPDEEDDGFLDPAAGHGTFIAGVVDQVAPGCSISLHRVISNRGDGDEVGIARRLVQVAESSHDRTIVNLSFGGGALDRPELLAWAVRRVQATGAVVVASAGNDATCRPTFPAALPDVVSVGALGPDGPAPFTNYGPWVRACAPGVDRLSTFFRFDGAEPAAPDGRDPDRFEHWARWSGTSFAAPAVAGALVRQMVLRGIDAREAVEHVIDRPGLLRLRDLGTVVNV
jgi:subtilisin family serine protease